MISTRTLLLLITSLVAFITAQVYITPDDHPSTSDISTLSLSHVLSHPTKYFTSNAQLLLAPGWYYCTLR